MAVLSSYEGTTGAPPISAGGFVFYSKEGEKFSSLHQVQPGLTVNTPESYPASSQIDSYITGGTTEMVSYTGSPSSVFMRTNGSRNSIYNFAYLDKPDGRKLDSWSRWDFNPELGLVIGMTSVFNGLIVFFLRSGGNPSSPFVYVVADLHPTTTILSLFPYLDSQRPYASVSSRAGSLWPEASINFAAAFNNLSNRYFTGASMPNVPSLLASYPSEPGLTAGAIQAASVTLTNPYMRDNKGKAILSGRLTITKMLIAFKNTIGFKWEINYREAVLTEVEYNGRVLGSPNNLIGIEPITTGQKAIPIGRETRQYTLTLSARRWYPFTVTAIEWVGQFFNRVQRF
jgi:hypothetical protein